jgi:multimeric flavodoxin WrbA
MKVLAFNGSPRKHWNTAMLLENALEGAASAGAETELIHLYDLNYKGCMSCFSCKVKDGASYGRCAFRDELTPILKQVENCDALILGSPVYLGSASGEMRSFMERLMFPFIAYTETYSSLFPKKIKAGAIYTMNLSREMFLGTPIGPHLERLEFMMKTMFGYAETLYSFDTLQFSDYSKYVSERFDPEQKEARRRDVFPEDCKNAFEMGVRLVS